jgi:hypothetical protein
MHYGQLEVQRDAARVERTLALNDGTRTAVRAHTAASADSRSPFRRLLSRFEMRRHSETREATPQPVTRPAGQRS